MIATTSSCSFIALVSSNMWLVLKLSSCQSQNTNFDPSLPTCFCAEICPSFNNVLVKIIKQIHVSAVNCNVICCSGCQIRLNLCESIQRTWIKFGSKTEIRGADAHGVAITCSHMRGMFGCPNTLDTSDHSWKQTVHKFSVIWYNKHLISLLSVSFDSRDT